MNGEPHPGKGLHPPKGEVALRVLGLDVGEKRIGVSISDPEGILARPLTTIERRDVESDMSAILELARSNGASDIVVGVPIGLDGQAGRQARATESFRQRLSRKSPGHVKRWDERFSSLEARRRLREAGMEPSRNKAKIDAAAASIVLQSYLDSLRRGS